MWLQSTVLAKLIID